MKRRKEGFVRSYGGIVLAAVVLLLATGCGASTDSTSTGGDGSTEAANVVGSSSITKPKLIEKGDAICERTDQRQTRDLKAYSRKHPGWESTKKGQDDAVVAAGLPPIDREVSELGKLGAPEGDVAEVRAIVSGIERALESAEKNPGSVLGESPDPFEKVGKLAGEYGFKACSSPS